MNMGRAILGIFAMALVVWVVLLLAVALVAAVLRWVLS